MITKEYIEEFKKTIPPRGPRGSPSAHAWERYDKKLESLIKQYEQEHGRSWWDDMKEAEK